MAFDLSPLLVPSQCAVVAFECLEGVIGEQGNIPGLAKSVRESRMLETLAGLLDSARSAGVRVFYCTVQKRPDGIGNPFNTPLEMRMREKSEASGGPAVPDLSVICPEVAPKPGDVVVEREHGMTGFYGNGLDAYLRNTGVRTVIMTGVSVNVGIMGTTIDAVNHGYQVIVPTDCVAGDPPEYAEQALRYSIRNVAFLSTSEEIRAHW